MASQGLEAMTLSSITVEAALAWTAAASGDAAHSHAHLPASFDTLAGGKDQVSPYARPKGINSAVRHAASFQSNFLTFKGDDILHCRPQDISSHFLTSLSKNPTTLIYQQHDCKTAVEKASMTNRGSLQHPALSQGITSRGQNNER